MASAGYFKHFLFITEHFHILTEKHLKFWKCPNSDLWFFNI